MVLLGHADILQLVNYWSSGIPNSVSGIDVVHGAHIGEEVPRVQGVSKEGWEIPTEAARRSAGKFQRSAGLEASREMMKRKRMENPNNGPIDLEILRHRDDQFIESIERG